MKRRVWLIVRKGAPIGVLLALAVFAALIARDAAAVRHTMDRGDFAFATVLVDDKLWQFDTTLPYAQEVFGIKDDLIYRRALKTYAVDEIGRTQSDSSPPALRAESQSVLNAAENSGLSPARRATLANLQGILSYDEALADPFNSSNLIKRTMSHFQRAVKADPGNSDAKYDLEFLLRLFSGESETIRLRQNIPAFVAGRSTPGGNPSRPGFGY